MRTSPGPGSGMVGCSASSRTSGPPKRVIQMCCHDMIAPYHGSDVIAVESAFACLLNQRSDVRKWRILLKKSFLADERNFSAPLVRPTRGDARDHIDLHKSDRRSSYLSYRGLQRRKQRKTDLREIFGAAQFSTFSTVSARSRRADGP